MEPRTHVLIVDDDARMRSRLRTLVEQFSDVEVVAEAEDGEAAIRAAVLHRPDIALMDVTMPRLNGLAATARIAEDAPGVRVIIVSIHNAPEYVQHALDAGARGYVSKDMVSAELETAIRVIARGGVYISSGVEGQDAGPRQTGRHPARSGRSGYPPRG
jgi:two-component system, NarL family, nitrate/nitrite response regulator NarL